LNQYWGTIAYFIETEGKNPVVSGAILLILGGVSTKLLPKIWRWFTRFVIWLWSKVRRQGADYTFEQRYLDWLINYHHRLSLIPARVVTRRWGERQKFVDLEKIYIRLSVSTESVDEYGVEIHEKGTSSWLKRPSLLSRIMQRLFRPWLRLFSRSSARFRRTYQSGDLGLIIDRRKHLVIRGDPGSGKTTLFRFLAVTCARARRKNKAEGDSSRLVKKRLLWDVHPFPILVTLRRHGKVTTWDESKELIDTFLEELPHELRKHCPEAFFERRLCQGNCLILLDGLDELGTAEARVTMARHIASFLQLYNQPTHRIVVTTRIVGYEGQLDRYGFATRTIQNLHIGEIRALVKLRFEFMIITDTAGQQPYERIITIKQHKQRSEQLIEKIESTPRLGQLATNPMLLSLIVQIYSLKVDLPEQRILLYRDCVEVLTERWQQVRDEEAGMHRDSHEELTIGQKLILLREIAFTMQKQRQEEGSQALIPRDMARDLIAEKLPDFLAGQLPSSEDERKAFCRNKAEEWIKSTMSESNILIELGLDGAGEPVVGFSHLTFQEYLTAEALNGNPDYRPLLAHNLLMPAWREVVLLYEALADDATPIISRLLASSRQPAGIILAGYCLAERLKKVQIKVQQKALAKLKEGFELADDQTVGEFETVMAAIGGSEVTAFLRRQLHHPVLSKRLAAIRGLGQTRKSSTEIAVAQSDLLQIVDNSDDVETVVAARKSLAQIGDPRFTGSEPLMICVPPQLQAIPLSPRGWKELQASPAWGRNCRFRQRLDLILKVLDYLYFTHLVAFVQRRYRSTEFEIGKYPVTNIEYSRFIEATGHRFPERWVEGKFPLKEAFYPVSGVTSADAEVYCKWLSQQTETRYRLPTEWEWEWAATGPDGRKYPWGDKFDSNKCNTIESGIDDATPVGSYRAAMSWIGASDMSGNAWEITTGSRLFSNIKLRIVEVGGGGLVGCGGIGLLVANLGVTEGLVVGFSLMAIGGLVEALAGFGGLISLLIGGIIGILLVLSGIIGILGGELVLVGGGLLVIMGSLTMLGSILEGGILGKMYVLRGGSWDTPSEQATCFHRQNYNDTSTKLCSFRCVRDISSTIT
jgi:hypothetical protein